MSIDGFEDWIASPLGSYLLESEQQRFDRMVADVFGFNAVQLGFEGFDLLRANRIANRFRAGRDGRAGLLADFEQLPFAGNSVDLLLMPHVLEFSANPHQVLREAERVLIPEGQVVISGFNPWSLWGLGRRALGRRDAYPWRGRFISLPRLKDWCALLGFEIVAGAFCCYVPPLANERWRERFRFMEKAGDRWWPVGAGVYVVQAKKRVHGMRLITPAWNEVAATRKALAPAAQKSEYEG